MIQEEFQQIQSVYVFPFHSQHFLNQATIKDHLKHLIGELRYEYDTKDHEFEKASEAAISSIPTILCEIERVSVESKKVEKQIEQFYLSLAKVQSMK